MNRLCLTMGDPAGVGPELIIRLLGKNRKKIPPLLIAGDLAVLHLALKKFGNRNAHACLAQAQVAERTDRLNPRAGLIILNLSRLKPSAIANQRGSRLHGAASWKYIKAGVQLCQSGFCSALVTLPVNKDSMLKAGCPFPGHTDLLAFLDHAPKAPMLMVLGKLRVALLTHHLPLKQVPSKIARREILAILKIMNRSLQTDFAIKQPRIAVLGLNPHAGEQGRIGREEILHVGPAVRQAKKIGINAVGPLPADSTFHRARLGEFDAILAMYHDQGIAPLKTLNFEKVVNITLGLSFIRTSPGHGTAYDIAWKGVASEQSLLEALAFALRLSRNRKRRNG